MDTSALGKTTEHAQPYNGESRASNAHARARARPNDRPTYRHTDNGCTALMYKRTINNQTGKGHLLNVFTSIREHSRFRLKQRIHCLACGEASIGPSHLHEQPPLPTARNVEHSSELKKQMAYPPSPPRTSLAGAGGLQKLLNATPCTATQESIFTLVGRTRSNSSLKLRARYPCFFTTL